MSATRCAMKSFRPSARSGWGPFGFGQPRGTQLMGRATSQPNGGSWLQSLIHAIGAAGLLRQEAARRGPEIRIRMGDSFGVGIFLTRCRCITTSSERTPAVGGRAKEMANWNAEFPGRRRRRRRWLARAGYSVGLSLHRSARRARMAHWRSCGGAFQRWKAAAAASSGRPTEGRRKRSTKCSARSLPAARGHPRYPGTGAYSETLRDRRAPLDAAIGCG